MNRLPSTVNGTAGEQLNRKRLRHRRPGRYSRHSVFQQWPRLSTTLSTGEEFHLAREILREPQGPRP